MTDTKPFIDLSTKGGRLLFGGHQAKQVMEQLKKEGYQIFLGTQKEDFKGQDFTAVKYGVPHICDAKGTKDSWIMTWNKANGRIGVSNPYRADCVTERYYILTPNMRKYDMYTKAEYIKKFWRSNAYFVEISEELQTFDGDRMTEDNFRDLCAEFSEEFLTKNRVAFFHRPEIKDGADKLNFIIKQY